MNPTVNKGMSLWDIVVLFHRPTVLKGQDFMK